MPGLYVVRNIFVRRKTSFVQVDLSPTDSSVGARQSTVIVCWTTEKELAFSSLFFPPSLVGKKSLIVIPPPTCIQRRKEIGTRHVELLEKGYSWFLHFIREEPLWETMQKWSIPGIVNQIFSKKSFSPDPFDINIPCYPPPPPPTRSILKIESNKESFH